MKTRLILLFALLAPLAPTHAQQPVEGYKQTVAHVKHLCAEKWAANYDMQLHCIQRQLLARLELLKMELAILKAENKPLYRALLHCQQQWTNDAGDINHRMALHCTQRQIEAWQKLQKLE